MKSLLGDWSVKFFYRKVRETARKNATFSETRKNIESFRFSTDPQSPKTYRMERTGFSLINHVYSRTKYAFIFINIAVSLGINENGRRGRNEDQLGHKVEQLHTCPRRQQIASTTRLMCRAHWLMTARQICFFPQFSIHHRSPLDCRGIFLFCFQTTMRIRPFDWT